TSRTVDGGEWKENRFFRRFHVRKRIARRAFKRVVHGGMYLYLGRGDLAESLDRMRAQCEVALADIEGGQMQELEAVILIQLGRLLLTYPAEKRHHYLR